MFRVVSGFDSAAKEEVERYFRLTRAPHPGKEKSGAEMPLSARFVRFHTVLVLHDFRFAAFCHLGHL